MKLKRTQIRLGGISRLPSERMTSDGECWESVNLVADNGETVASRFPAVVEDDGLPPAFETDVRLVFVHTTNNYTHYIVYKESSRNLGIWNDEGGVRFLTLDEDEELRDIVNIGNTLVISTTKYMHYVLWKDGEYNDLGTELPKPSVTFYGTELQTDKVFDLQEAWDETIWMDYPHITESVPYQLDKKTEIFRHGYYFCGNQKYQEVDDDNEATENARTQAIWDAYASAVAAGSAFNRLKSVNGTAFMQPYFFRYALRLYDGTYAMQSVPILIGSGEECPVLLGDTYLDYNHRSEGRGHHGFAMVMAYKIHALLENRISTDWSDIVQSIDIFCSSPINIIDPGAAPLTSLDSVYVTDINDGFCDDTNGKHMISVNDDNEYIQVSRYWQSSSQTENKLLTYNVFYRIGSFLVANDGTDFSEDYDPAQEFTANQDDLREGIWLKRPDTDALVTHANTSEDNWDDYECDHYLYGGSLKTMNSRLMMWDARKRLGTGLPVLNSAMRIDTEYSDTDKYVSWDGGYYVCQFKYMYVIEVQGETKYVWGRYLADSDTAAFDPFSPHLSRLGTHYTDVNPLTVCGWLSYPDVNCKRVVFSYNRIASIAEQDDGFHAGWYGWSEPRVFEMKEHPFLNCSYSWLGFGKYFGLNTGGSPSSKDREMFEMGTEGEDRELASDNRVFQSWVDNPFTFPASGRYAFDYSVISVATSNLPISQGQYGEFPLYVFTEGGIYAMQMSSDGTFVSSSPFSRDVALSRKTVSEVDRGVIFATVKGVRAIEGGQISDLSALMLGEPLPFPDSLADILADCGFGNGVAEAGAMRMAYMDETPFLSFLEGAECVYDYTGQRLVFVNADFTYQYVYRMTTGSWHKTFLYSAAYGLQNTSCAHLLYGVNSYPKCYVTATSGTGNAVLDLGTALEPARRDDYNDGRTLGILLTRTMDLGSPDVFKSIRDLRVRGDFPKGDVQYVLLASNNNRDWVVRESLRGPSFRFYRLLLVTRLSEFGRIAYVEMDYEERFSNRLR